MEKQIDTEIPKGYIEHLINSDLLGWYLDCCQLATRFDGDRKLSYEAKIVVIGAEILRRMNTK